MKMKIRTTVALAACGLVVAGCASPGKLAREEAGYPREKVDARGLFLENCATCHGKDGRARTFHGWLVGAQDLTDPIWRAVTSNDEIIHAIETGPKVMPAFGKKLSQTEIEALAVYVQKFAPAQQ
jgi:cbb3-type cytochrome c oxidase subunit III